MLSTPLLLTLAALSPVTPQAETTPLALAPAAATNTPLPAAHIHGVQHLVKVHSTPRGLLRMQRLDLDIIRIDMFAGEATVLVTPDELELLVAAKLDVTIEIEDLAAYYARRLAAPTAGLGGGNVSGTIYGQWLTPAFGQGSMGGYYTFPEVESVLDQLSAAYPQFVSPKSSIGQTIEGRELWMVRVSDNPNMDENEPEVRIDAMHHAREPEGMQATLYFLCYLLEEYGNDPLATYLLDERELYVLPCVNPDGYEYNRSQSPGGGGLWRKNRRDNGNGTFGIDLNRNYPFQWGGSGSSGDPGSTTYRGPSPESEPEIAAMTQFISSRSFATALSVHTYSDLWLAPWGYDNSYPPDWNEIKEIGDLAAEDNGYEHGPASLILYVADGVTFDYDYGVHGTYGWTPEIGSSADGFWPPQSRIIPLAQDNVLSFARTVLAAGPWIRPLAASLTDVGDGDGSFEAGEGVEIVLAVRNSGRDDSGTVQLDLATTSAAASVTVAQATLTVASFTTEVNGLALRLDIAPGTPAGITIPFTVTVTEGGRPQTFDGEITVGVRVIASFDFEAIGDEGWAVGVPNTATTGEWTRADPVGTAAQPENDNTVAPGVNCWFTGQGAVGGSLGQNDVDGGHTTLVSPPFDLAGASSASIRYARWYSNDTGAEINADIFEVDLSDDDGVTWTSAEVVGPTGAGTSGGWIEAEVDVAAYVALTAEVRIRFVASDLAGGSIIEAAIDDVVVRVADPSCPQPVNYCVTSPNNWTAGAVIGAIGSTDVTQNALVLTVSDANPSGFGLFFYGQGRTQVPAGNGAVCIATGLTRLPVVQSDPAGYATFAVDFATLVVPIANGETWSFQYWMRDVGGSGYNYSDGLEIVFCP